MIIHSVDKPGMFWWDDRDPEGLVSDCTSRLGTIVAQLGELWVSSPVLLLTELLVAFLLLNSISKRLFAPGPKTQRAWKSWNLFPIAFFILFGIAASIVSSSELSGRTKNLLHVVNATGLFYLCLFDSWFRNKIVGIASKSKGMWEGYR
jgi:hypothetical protein